MQAHRALHIDETCAGFHQGYLDLQMDTIKFLLKPHYQAISESKNEIVALSYKMKDIIQEYLDNIIDLKWQGPNSKLALIGGIMINCEGDGTDMFLPLSFDIKTQTETYSLFDETFKGKGLF